MQRRIFALLLAFLLVFMVGCQENATPSTTTTQKPMKNGWWAEGDNQYYYINDTMQTGWLELDGNKYYFAADGKLQTGWVETADGRFYFAPDGSLGQGMLIQDGITYYLTGGQLTTGWVDEGNNRYYFGDDGSMHTGWLEMDGVRYFFRDDGRMGKGKVYVSDTEYHYFTGKGEEILLVNPWNFLPDGYTVKSIAYNSTRSVAEICYEPLCKMIADCEAATNKILMRSAYRTHNDQQYLYNNRVQRFINEGMSREQAKIEAAKIVAIPGTSEHELGLAVDLVDINYQKLDEKQEETPVQQWLMEHCWEYGFILRYPNDKSEVTGIVYEPWHYRYVGVELALELRDSGLCLEEYLDQLTEK